MECISAVTVMLVLPNPRRLLLGAGQLPRLIGLEGSLARLPDVAVVYGPGTIMNQIAIASQAMLVVSRDHDLLDLMNESNVQGTLLRKSYPSFQVLTPPGFLELLRSS